jgi:hypothetical protein
MLDVCKVVVWNYPPHFKKAVNGSGKG